MSDTSHVTRSVVEAFFAAFAVRDAQKVGEFLHPDVRWTISGPVDVLPFCGTHHGKDTVIDVMARRAPAVLRVFHFVPQFFLVDGNNASSLTRLSARRTSDNRVISYRVANFFRFLDDKVIENFSLLDSFDAVEQLLGHPLAVHSDAPKMARDDIFAV